MPRFGLVRQIVRLAIPDLYREFKTANSAYKFIQSIGFGYRRTDFLADWREILSIPEKKTGWKYMRRDYRPTDRMFLETELDLSKRYQYISKVGYVNKAGYYTEKRISFLSDERLTKREVMWQMESIVAREKEKYGIVEISDIDIEIGRMKKYK